MWKVIFAGTTALTIVGATLALAQQVPDRDSPQRWRPSAEDKSAFTDAQLAEEGQQLVASEKTLREEVQALNQNISQFNAAMAEQNKAVQTFQTQCPAHTKDQALSDACDKRIAQLREQANLLEDDRLQLRARQEELNARVDKQNAWGRDYGKRKGVQDSHGRLNQRDSDEWLGRAKQFFA
jgi:predicted RNase H-like nuclease (RuvC/YqgF family)